MIIDFEKNLSEAYGLFCLLKCSMTFAVASNLLEFHGKTVHWKVFLLLDSLEGTSNSI